MSVIDTDGFVNFLSAFDTFFAKLNETIRDDKTLQAYVSRARSASVTFETAVDTQRSGEASGLDIGSFLNNFEMMCQPGHELGLALSAALTAYNGMFVVSSVGPGTAAGTGMNFIWPTHAKYKANQNFWDAILFKGKTFATYRAPHMEAFLKYFLSLSLLSSDSSSSVAIERASGQTESICVLDARPSGKPNSTEGGLMYDTKVDIQPDRVSVSAVIDISVSYVVVEYGIDFTTALKQLLLDKGYTPHADDSLYLQGGNVLGAYRGSTFSADWNRDLYFLNITGNSTYEALYAVDQGGGSKNVPVLYFPESQRQQLAKLQFLDFLFFDFDYWQNLGAMHGFLSFSVSMDETATTSEQRVMDSLNLFTSTSDQKAFVETPRSARGLIIPLIYVKAKVQGRTINVLPGGFHQTIINWREDIDYNVIAVNDQKIFNAVQDTDAVVVTMRAYDFNGNQNDDSSGNGGTVSFDIIRSNRTSDITLNGDQQQGQEAMMAEDKMFGSSSSGKTNYSYLVHLVLVLLGQITWLLIE